LRQRYSGKKICKFKTATEEMSISIRYLPVYWSKQHGAYITLISAWVIAVITHGFNPSQILVILFLLSGLNVTELLGEKIKRKTALPRTKHSWLIIYGIITSVLCLILLLQLKISFTIAAALLTGCILYVALSKLRLQKTMLMELITFFLFSLAGFIGCTNIQWSSAFPLIILMTIYFGSSVFTVKERFGKIGRKPVVLFVLISIIIILGMFNRSAFALISSGLLILKTAGSWGFRTFFHRLPIKTIGMIELGFQVLFVINLIATGI
jgi:hypothetical protein